MQPANPISSTQPLARSVTPATSATQAAYTAVSQIATENNATVKLEVGQLIQATIQEQVSPGLYKVQVAEQSMQMQLPGLIKIGSTITLQVVSVSPKLTFSVPGSGAPISTAEEISSTSRLLSDLAQMPLSKTMVEAPTGRAVWPSEKSAPESGQLAAALKDALGNSGLFYESHQAQWIAGARSTAQLLIEPQNQLAPGAKNLPSVSQPATQATATEAATMEPAIISGKAVTGTALATDSSIASAGSATNPGTAIATGHASETNPALPIAKELIPLVQQQLHTLETHQLAWSGQVWPNQQMQWEIQGEPEHRSSRPDERQWKTEMELALPRLGDVHASLVFNQGVVRLTLHAENNNAAALFDRRLPELAASMKNVGIPLSGAVVEKS